MRERKLDDDEKIIKIIQKYIFAQVMFYFSGIFNKYWEPKKEKNA